MTKDQWRRIGAVDRWCGLRIDHLFALGDASPSAAAYRTGWRDGDPFVHEMTARSATRRQLVPSENAGVAPPTSSVT